MIKLKGTLEMPDSLDNEYIINNHNLNKIFWAIYHSDVKLPSLSLKIEQGIKLIKYIDKGDIRLRRNKNNNYIWFIAEVSIDDLLFDHVGEEIEITIKTEDVPDEQLRKL